MTLPLALQAAALQWRDQGRAGMVVEVQSHQGSVPREAGTRMLVAADAVLGTIGGGHLELQAIERARQLLAQGQRAEQRLALGPSLGQCCGGALVLSYQPLAQSAPETWSLPAPRFLLDLYGAGHVGRAIVRLLAGIDCRVRWLDERASEFPAEPLPPHITPLCSEGLPHELAATPAGAGVLILTHSHDLDLALTEAALARDDLPWVGLIGSATKRARFLHRLESKGLRPEQLARLCCPIGLPGIAGKEPEVIAVAVVAQLLQLSSTGDLNGHL
ncbi:xanthine dehydrogenase accessory protein XdhC [Inhella proteolytica]|uniref:Xanthine dehydrogenase accessory protein XdhC n=1 Tax=Inhella proteolytica TaxID=2795029 RepID=A0A931NFJ5_9BURK|nr:xanthine dehydrogenase accessory protein XdhC [Inhella proteolytica]MBH9575688.1 xanthine dehydrogenase accessory protein XdhC [Inhella proteolytica]